MRNKGFKIRNIRQKEESEFNELKQIVIDAGKEFNTGFRSGNRDIDAVDIKSHQMDIVTIYDKAIDKFLMERITKLFPSLTYIGEENYECLNKEDRARIDFNNVIIVDPIDGTSGFFKQIPICAISVAVVIGGVEKYGIIYNPISNQIYYGIKGEGAYHSSIDINVGERINENSFSESVDVRMAYGEKPGSPVCNTYDKIVETLVPMKDVRMMSYGSCVLESVFVATQSLGGYLNNGTAIWDLAAAKIILGEVGIKMYELDEFPGKLKEVVLSKIEYYSFICYNKKIESRLLDLLRII